MTDPAEPDPSTPLADLVAEVIEQAPELAGLDGPRAEVWASDVLSLAAEIDPDHGVSGLLAALAASTGAGAGVARAALSAFEVTAGGVAGADPPWRPFLGTSRCDGAWLLSSGAARSAAFHFTDGAEVAHVVTVDLVPGPPETVGEVGIGPGELLDALAEEDARITAEEAAPDDLAGRVVRALAATDHPHQSAVAAGRLLALRLGTLVAEPVRVPVAAVEEVPPPPERDPEDDAWALDVLRQALGEPPVIDEPAVLTVAEIVAPTDLAPFTPAEREAIGVLEWADWLGAVISVVRAGPGASVGGEELVDAVNRCPEVTTTIPKADRSRVAWAFDVLTASWSELGLVVDGRLTERGATVLPAALARAWGGPPAAAG